MPDVLLSFTGADAGLARRLSQQLRTNDLTVVEDRAIVEGAESSNSIENILNSTVVVILLSSSSSRGSWVEAEMRAALESRRAIIPVLLDARATKNWVWPLIADRQPIRVDSAADLNNVVTQVLRVAGRAARVPSRFLFGATSVAYGGRITRPDDFVIGSTGGSVLSVTGGRSVWRDRNIKIGRSFRIRSAETSAEGLFDNLRETVRVTRGRLPIEALSAITTTSAACRGVVVGGAPPPKRGDEPGPLMTVAGVSAKLMSRSDRPGDESSIVVEDALISPVTFDSPVYGRFRLDIILDIAPFKRSMLVAGDAAETGVGAYDLVMSTIVKALAWQGREYPASKPLGVNGVWIPNLGRFYFGELLLTTQSTRLTLIRMELDSSTVCGSAVVVDLRTSGMWT